MAPKNTDVDKKKTEKEADPIEKLKDSGIPEEGELSEEDQELKWVIFVTKIFWIFAKKIRR